MDTKWKNNKILRRVLVFCLLALVTAANLAIIPMAVKEVQQIRKQHAEEEKSWNLDENLLREYYKGAYVLYSDYLGVTSGQILYGDDTDVMANWQDSFRSTFNSGEQVDYCLMLQNDQQIYEARSWNVEKETVEKLSAVVSGNDPAVEQELQEKYRFYLVLSFDKDGMLSIDKFYDTQVSSELFQESFYGSMKEVNAEAGMGINRYRPIDCKVVYAVTEENYNLAYENNNIWDSVWVYSQFGIELLPLISIAVIAIVALLLGNPQKLEKRRFFLFRYPLFLAACGIYLLAMWVFESFAFWVWEFEYNFFSANLPVRDGIFTLLSGDEYQMLLYVISVLMLFGVYWVAYLVIAAIRPIFSLGIVGYLREKTLIWQILKRCKSVAQKWKEETEGFYMGEKHRKRMFIILAVNFIILALISCFWFIGIPLLLIYTAVLYFIIQKYYRKISDDYQVLYRAAKEIADGNLETALEEPMGLYEPLKEQLSRLQEGMKFAVEEEVKSQRMKTELITNVSHDLKTPLTAITTYIELLKNPELTQDERAEYIATLERKSLRLKTLIEDLFEVSKTASNDIALDKTDVDVVSLLKQAAVEQQEQWQKAELNIRWMLPEEKIILLLDSQKTYRIFENLFGNISKYALPGTRVYIDVLKEQKTVLIVLRNISKGELNFRADEIVERFVRGDQSRTTEGSGLGLAIAKNLVEAQGGSLKIELDGDLFKIVISWPV